MRRAMLQEARGEMHHVGAGEEQLQCFFVPMHTAGGRQRHGRLTAQDGDPANPQQGFLRGGEMQLLDHFKVFEVEIRLEEAVEQRHARRAPGLEPAHEVGQ